MRYRFDMQNLKKEINETKKLSYNNIESLDRKNFKISREIQADPKLIDQYDIYSKIENINSKRSEKGINYNEIEIPDNNLRQDFDNDIPDNSELIPVSQTNFIPMLPNPTSFIPPTYPVLYPPIVPSNYYYRMDQ